jgi:hypothetical protein
MAIQTLILSLFHTHDAAILNFCINVVFSGVKNTSIVTMTKETHIIDKHTNENNKALSLWNPLTGLSLFSSLSLRKRMNR